MNQPMSRSTSVTSDMNHQPPSQPPQHTAHPPATPSPAPKEDSPAPTFVIPKKSSAIKIVNPNTNAEITFTRAAKVAATAPDRTPSPAKTPVKQVVKSVSHSPAPSVVEERPPSAQKTKGEIAEEMKAKFKASMEETRKKKEAEAEEVRKKKEAAEEEVRRKQAEKDEAERLERERIEKEKREEEERIAREKKEEEERLEKERLEKERLEQERIQREKEEEERKKAEEERIAKEKAEEEERLAKEKAEKDAAEAARIAKEKEEQEAKAKEVEAAAAAATAAAAVAVTATAVSEETPASPERRSSLGSKKPALPALSITPVSDGLQAAALKNASFITPTEFALTKYPEGTNPPNPKTAQTFGEKGFHYDPEFLIQFRDVWKDKPNEDWDAHMKNTMGDMESRPSRPVSQMSRGPPSGAFAGIGNFSIAKPVPPRTGIPPLGQFTPIQPSFPQRGPRVPSSGPGIQSPASPRAPSTNKRNERNDRSGSRRQPVPQPPPPPPEPPVDPLPQNPNRWKPTLRAQETVLGPPPGGDGKLPPEVVQRKVKSLLNKLTLEKFDKITDQILEIASQSRHETDGRTLRQIIQLTFEKATDEPNFSEMYALFCRKIMETIDPNITDPTVLNKDGQPLTGGQLFRKYLLNRCQEEFERGWKVNLPAKPDENELLSDEYYIAAKAKRQGLGLVQFIGELFKLNMLIEKIMYECIIRLLGGTDQPHPEPEEVESLCRLLVTVGKPLDEGRARSRMNAIYDALDQIRQVPDLESRIKFKILDILELRRHGWVSRTTGQQGPKTIQEIHDDVRASRRHSRAWLMK
jgi:translation initiation factor 4G